MHSFRGKRRKHEVSGRIRCSQVTAASRRAANPLDLLCPLALAVVAAILLGFIVAPGAGRAQTDDSTSNPSAAGGLQTMLERVPAFFPREVGWQSYETATISYANIAAQLDAVGIAPPTSTDDPAYGYWNRATLGLELPAIAQYNRQLRTDLGFDLLQADETLEIYASPFHLTMIRGRIDQVGVLVALTQLGYTPVEPGSSILAIRPDYEEDFSGPAGYAWSLINVATFLADGTLVFASARNIIEAVLAVQNGQEDSLVDRADVAALLHHVPPDLASAVIVDGQRLESPDAAPTDAGSMPPVVLALLGNTVGGPIQPNLRTGTPTPIRDDAPTSREIVILLMRSVESAVAAVPVVEARLDTGASRIGGATYHELFSGWAVRAVPGEPVLLIDLTLGEVLGQSGYLFNKLSEADLDFIAWK